MKGGEGTSGCENYLACFHVLEIHANLAGDAFSEPEVGCSDLAREELQRAGVVVSSERTSKAYSFWTA